MSARLRLWLALWLLVCATVAFAPNLGRGFVGEDFDWLRQAAVGSSNDLSDIAVDPVAGHYRPLVSATFVGNQALTGLSPLGHGLINFALACTGAATIGWLAAASGLGYAGAATAAVVYLFSPDTVGPATTAIVGRSQLLAALLGAAAALASLRRRPALSGVFTAAAVASHETMWPLPLVLAAWTMVDVRGRPRAGTVDSRRSATIAAVGAAARRTWPAFVASATVVLLRVAAVGGGDFIRTGDAASGAGASALMSAASPGELLARGAAGLVFAAALAAVSAALAICGRLDADERRTLLYGIVWAVPGAAHTILAGVSAVVPVALDAAGLSVGAALVGAAAGRSLIRHLSRRTWLVVNVVAVLVPLLAIPLAWQRNAGGRAEARLASDVLQRLFRVLRERPDIQRVEVYQAVGEEPSIERALAPGLAAALELGTGRRLSTLVSLASPSDPWPAPQAFTLRLTVAGDEFVAVAPPLDK